MGEPDRVPIKFRKDNVTIFVDEYRDESYEVTKIQGKKVTWFNKDHPQLAPCGLYEDMFSALVEYAHDNGFSMIHFQDLKKDKEKVLFQQDSFDANDTAVFSEEEKVVFFKEYVEADHALITLEQEFVDEKKNLKTKYDRLILEQSEVKADVEKNLRYGRSEFKSDASWERLPQNELMVLIRHKDLVAIQFKEMDEEQKSQSNLFDPDVQEETIGEDA